MLFSSANGGEYRSQHISSHSNTRFYFWNLRPLPAKRLFADQLKMGVRSKVSRRLRHMLKRRPWLLRQSDVRLRVS